MTDAHGTREPALTAPSTLESYARAVVEQFKTDEAAGYRSKDRQYAISLLEKGLTAPATPTECTHRGTRRMVRCGIGQIQERGGDRCVDCGAVRWDGHDHWETGTRSPAPPQGETPPQDWTALLTNDVLDRAWFAMIKTLDGNNYVGVRRVLADALKAAPLPHAAAPQPIAFIQAEAERTKAHPTLGPLWAKVLDCATNIILDEAVERTRPLWERELALDGVQRAAHAAAGTGLDSGTLAAALTDADDSLAQAHEDLRAILRELGLFDGARPESPHAVVVNVVLPAIAALREATRPSDALVEECHQTIDAFTSGVGAGYKLPRRVSELITRIELAESRLRAQEGPHRIELGRGAWRCDYCKVIHVHNDVVTADIVNEAIRKALAEPPRGAETARCKHCGGGGAVIGENEGGMCSVVCPTCAGTGFYVLPPATRPPTPPLLAERLLAIETELDSRAEDFFEAARETDATGEKSLHRAYMKGMGGVNDAINLVRALRVEVERDAAAALAGQAQDKAPDFAAFYGDDETSAPATRPPTPPNLWIECTACVTEQHCQHHHRCLAECSPADLALSRETVEARMSDAVMREVILAWALAKGDAQNAMRAVLVAALAEFKTAETKVNYVGG